MTARCFVYASFVKAIRSENITGISMDILM